MIERTDIDYKLQQALEQESMVDVGGVTDLMVQQLPTDVKRTCLAISDRLEAQGINDDRLLRLKRTAKVMLSVHSTFEGVQDVVVGDEE